MAVTAHPLATQAALDMLARGGSPVDAAIAAQMVLGLVEPQSSGIGGGTLVMLWDEKARKLSSWDGLAAAPARATASLRTDVDGKLLPGGEPLSRSGRAVGVPGTLPVLRAVHERHGRLPWADLFAPAIAHAEAGFPIPKYLHGILAQPDGAANHAEWRSLYFDGEGRPLPVGTIVRNPAYAKTMQAIATQGPAAWLAGEGARAIVAAARRGLRSTLMTEQDVLDYRPAEREPVCAPFLAYRVCTMAPPSFGGIHVLQTLQMTAVRANGRFDFADPAFVHLYAEAGKLAQADRRRFVGDPGFVTVPVATLANPGYAMVRALSIDLARANPDPQPGIPMGGLAALESDASDPVTTTSQIAIADAAGNALSITTTINLNFGARLAPEGGFVLNNALTNFSAAPKPGETIANQMAPRKRPVTSMSPTIVFDADGRPVVVGGSAGGGPIVDYIASSLIEILANGRTPREALAAGHVSTAVAGKVQLEKGTPAEALAPGLAARGHDVQVVPLLSGLGFLKRTPEGWIGAADPRRDGVAMGLPAP
ncbi:MAG: gamma-glutamyltransferase family protein [Betaproteobacteria bacterium]|nr:gamma-glutamyltransferase family protein [Betaproteobacteria bacterium]